MIYYIISLTLLILALVCIRAVFRKKLPPRIVYALWLVVLVRMLLPFSLFNVTVPETAETPITQFFERSADTVYPTKTEQSGHAEYPGISQTAEQGESISPMGEKFTPPEYHDSTNLSAEAGYATSASQPAESEQYEEHPAPSTWQSSDTVDSAVTEHVSDEQQRVIPWKTVCNAVWATGAAVILLWFAVSGAVFSHGLRKNRRVHSSVGKTKIYLSSGTGVPCVSGIVPAIYINPEAVENSDVNYIIRHEMTHISHGDSIWSRFRILALVVFWYNPVVWLAAFLSKRDAELAVDDSIAAQLDEAQRVDYARAILDTVPVKRGFVSGFGSAPLKERISLLTKKRKTSIIAFILAVALTLSAVGCAFIGTKSAEDALPDEEGTADETDVSGDDNMGSDEVKEDSDTDHAADILDVRIINEDECSAKLVTAEDCTLISSELFYNERNGKTCVYTPDVFFGNYYSFVSIEDSNFVKNTVDAVNGKPVRNFTVKSNYALSESVIADGKLYWAPDSMNAAEEECVSLYEFDLLTAAVDTIAQIPISYIKVDISALDDNNIVFLVNRKDGEDAVPTVYNYDNKEKTLSVVCENRDTDEKICCFDTYGGQIIIITVKDDKGWKIHSLKTYSKDGKLISSDEFRALDSYVQKHEYKNYYMEYFGDYITMKLEEDGNFINYPTFEKTDDGYRMISFNHIGNKYTTMAEPANGHYYTVGISSSLGQIAVIDTEKHEPSFIRFDMGKDKTVSSEKIYCNEDGKLLFVTTDADGNELLWAVNDSLEEVVLNGKPGRFTVTADSLDELKKCVDDGTLGQSGEEFYDYFYSFFVEGWKFPEVNEVKFSDISFSFTYPFVNTDGIDIDFTIVESPLEELKPGKYSIKVAEGMMDFYITGLNEEKNEKTIEMLRKYEEVHKLLLFFNSCRLWNTPAYGKGVTYPGAMDFVHVYYGETGNWYKLDEESLFRHLEEDFGVTEPEKLTVQGTLLGDGQYNSLYERYPQEQRSVLDVKETSDGIEVTVRFYADTEMLIRSHLIVYYFDKDSRFNGYTVLEKGKYEPAGIHYVPDDDKEADETDKTPDKSDETPDEVYTIPKKEIKSYLYFYATSSGHYFCSKKQYNAEKEGYTAFHALPCRSARADQVSMNKRYAIIEDGQYFIYDFIDGKRVCDLLFLNPYIPELTTHDDTLPQYLKVEDSRLRNSNDYNRYSLYDLDQNKFVTDKPFDSFGLNDEAGLLCFMYYNADSEDSQSKFITTVLTADTFEEIMTVEGFLMSEKIGDKKVFVNYPAPGWPYGFTEVYDYDCRLILSDKDGIEEYKFTSDGNIVTYPSENSTTFSIYDKDLNLIKRSREYDQVNAVFGDWVCVTEDGMLKITDNDETVVYALAECEENVIVRAHMCGASEEPMKMTLPEDRRNSFAENVGTADAPVYEDREVPDELPAGLHILCENRNVEFEKDGSGIEYYFIPETCKIYREIFRNSGGYEKPVLYLYPEEETDFTVTFDRPETLTVTYPKYISEWSGTVVPDGTITDARGRTYYSLYWEESAYAPADFSTGFCVKREDCAEFLEDALEKLGLTEREANEFIIYWLPEMEKNEYTLVHFELTEEREAYNGLNITPKVDSLLRIAMHIKPSETFVSVEPQYLPTFERVGFTAIEWGGARER